MNQCYRDRDETIGKLESRMATKPIRKIGIQTDDMDNETGGDKKYNNRGIE